MVIQSETQDRSTDGVISWLNYLNPQTEITSFFNNCVVEDFEMELDATQAKVTINGKSFTAEESFWYRRGEFLMKRPEQQKGSEFIEKIQYRDFYPLIESLNNGFNKNSINKFEDNAIEKTDMLFFCHKLNILFPETLISGNKDNVLAFFRRHQKIISKGIKYPFITYNNSDCQIGLDSSTKLIENEKDIIDASDFAPSLFQKYIKKQIEIRSFYLKGQFRSMAIFSQQNKKTMVDYRNYDRKRPNRLVPFKLPNSYENKLHRLMDALGLNCGSFDIIYTPSGNYYFLEVNPVGQFQWLSTNCNYFLERMIAKELKS